VAGSETGNVATTSAGTYALSETSVTGYTNTSITCSNSSGQVTSVTVGLGENVTCTFVNDDNAASLTLIKHVVNDNGGTASASDFTLNVSGSSPTPGSFQGAEAPGTSVALNAGTYNVGETGPSGYQGAFSSDCSGSIAVGDEKTCTVTNDDVRPKLIVVKHVVNDNGGAATASDFTMAVTGSSPSPASFPGAEAPGTPKTG